MDAIASYRRAQYYPSSNVQSSNLLEDGVEDNSSESALSESDGISQQQSCHSAPRAEGNVISVMDQENSVDPSAWAIPVAHHGRSDTDNIRATPGHSSLVETCPLLNNPQGHLDAPGLVSSSSGQFTAEGHLLNRSASSIHQTNAQGTHEGRSTYGQTLFNCIAVLLGIGMLSEPLAFSCMLDGFWALFSSRFLDTSRVTRQSFLHMKCRKIRDCAPTRISHAKHSAPGRRC